MAVSTSAAAARVSRFAGNARVLRAAAPAAPAASRGALAVTAKDRPMWLTGTTPPKHLDGTLAGDYGFDPLGLGVCPDRLKWYVEAEKTNGRWAMAAVAGILFTDAVGKGNWFEAGAQEYGIPPLALLAIQAPILGFLETKRLEGWLATGQSGVVNTFPFDPLGQNGPDKAVKEIKNGRLAMVAFIGFAVQAIVTRTGPLENLNAHLSNPFANNIIGSVNALPQTLGQ